MFSKAKTRPQPAPVPIPDLPDLPSPGAAKRAATAPAGAPTQSGKASSLLASDIKFEGNISGNGELQIEGNVKGDVRVGRLVIGETGIVEGGVTAEYVEVRGRIVGAVNGKQIKLLGTAYVDGDITHEQLSIDVGAYFQGRCLQQRKDAPAPAAAPTQTQQQSQQSAPQPAAQQVRTPDPQPVQAQFISMKPA